jgi:hypothetical protein
MQEQTLLIDVWFLRGRTCFCGRIGAIRIIPKRGRSLRSIPRAVPSRRHNCGDFFCAFRCPPLLTSFAPFARSVSFARRVFCKIMASPLFRQIGITIVLRLRSQIHMNQSIAIPMRGRWRLASCEGPHALAASCHVLRRT